MSRGEKRTPALALAPKLHWPAFDDAILRPKKLANYNFLCPAASKSAKFPTYPPCTGHII